MERREHDPNCPGRYNGCTLGSADEAAQICRDRGWGRDTVLEGDEGYGPDRIRITAVGDHCILAVQLPDDYEGEWGLDERCWVKIVE